MIEGVFHKKKDQFSMVSQHIRNDRLWVLLLLFAVFLVVVNCLRLNWNIFWGDEVYSIDVAKMSFSEIIDYGMNTDSHPPLYNLMLHLFCLVFGHNVVTYNVVPMVAYIGLVLLTITSIYRYFGKIVSFSMLILSAALTSSFYFVSECRMYELGAFLILASFIQLYKLLSFGRRNDYFWFLVCTIAAAYTHYYCVITVAFFYLILLIDPIIKKNGNFKKGFLMCLIAVLSYLPWVIFAFVNTFSRDSKSFWISNTMSFKECCEYLFYADNGMMIFVVFCVLVIILLVTNMLRVHKNNKGIRKMVRNIDPETTWVVAGLISIFGTIAVGLIVSEMTRPLIYPRYLYPMTAVAWILFSVGLSRLDLNKAKRVIPTLLLVLLLSIGIPNIHASYDDECGRTNSSDRICESTNEILVGKDIIITDQGHLNNNVLEYYFPDTSQQMIKDNTEKKLDPTKHYVLYLSYVPDDNMVQKFSKYGYSLEFIDEGSFAKSYYVHVYDVQKI